MTKGIYVTVLVFFFTLIKGYYYNYKNAQVVGYNFGLAPSELFLDTSMTLFNNVFFICVVYFFGLMNSMRLMVKLQLKIRVQELLFELDNYLD